MTLNETTDATQSRAVQAQELSSREVHAIRPVVSGEALDLLLRDATDDDSWDLIGLIASCWAEYPGCILDLDGEVPYYRTIATSFASWGGRFWVAEHQGRVVGSIGLAPGAAPDEAELRMLYVARPYRRRGLARRLVALFDDEARARGARSITLWSDTRFVEAHAFYEQLGYTRAAYTRELHDLSHTVEYNFTKRLV
jgi:putative acetyltransferase